MSAGRRASWAADGEGKDSMTETRRAVDTGNQELKRVVRIARGSRVRVTCGAREIFRDFVIFSVRTGSLYRETC
jgi:hypothetical protein